MANIRRYDPFDDDFDDLFRGFLMRPFRSPTQTAPQMKLDVSDSDDKYTVCAEMPGVKKEDINVSVHGNQVEISGEIRNEKQTKVGERSLHTERTYGRVYRTFTLGQDVDDTKCQAKYDNGVLELTLPKKATPQSKRLQIT
jgi:HSP20 family protein